MTPQSIVVSLEIAKALKEAGWDWQDTHFVWFCCGSPMVISTEDKGWTWDREMTSELIAAPTLIEILNKIPDSWKMEVDGKNRDVFLVMGKDKCDISCWDYDSIDGACLEKVVKEFLEDTLTDSVASLWLYLKSQNLL